MDVIEEKRDDNGKILYRKYSDGYEEYYRYDETGTRIYEVNVDYCTHHGMDDN